MTIDDLEIIKTMEQFGGSFVQKLAMAARYADDKNMDKLRFAFADEWVKYAALVKARNAAGRGYEVQH